MTDIAATLDAVLRRDRGRCLAALISRTGDFQKAEDALQDAATSALLHWGRAGVPDRPMAWLLRTAFRKAIDSYRKEALAGRHAAAMAVLAREEADAPDPEAIPDERLRLIFTCCHPALDAKSRVALTLRSLGGLSTAQVAAAFLDSEPAMGQRLSRARAKIAAAGIPFAVPGPKDWEDRLNSVLTVIYLIFNAAYSAPATATDLAAEAIFLARLVLHLRPHEAESEGLLALLLLTQARAPARTGKDGVTVPLSGQDRALWDGAMIAEGLATLDTAMARGRAGPFQIKAAISALHVAEGPSGTDWAQILLLYDALLKWEPTAVVRLNRAVVLAEAGQGGVALDQLRGLAAELEEYQPFHAALADLEARFGTLQAALFAYSRAESMSSNPADRAFLRLRAETAKKKGRDEARPKSNREVKVHRSPDNHLDPM